MCLATVGSLHIALMYLLSPLSSAITNVWSERFSAFAGASLITAGYFYTANATNIDQLFYSWGILMGVGSSLLYAPSILILGHYFKKKLGTASALAGLGTSFFTILLPIAMSVTIPKHGLPYTLRMVGYLFATTLLAVLAWTPQFHKPKRYRRRASLTSRLTADMHETQHFLLSRFFRPHIWKNKSYRYWALILPIGFVGFFVPFVHLVSKTFASHHL